MFAQRRFCAGKGGESVTRAGLRSRSFQRRFCAGKGGESVTRAGLRPRSFQRRFCAGKGGEECDPRRAASVLTSSSTMFRFGEGE